MTSTRLIAATAALFVCFLSIPAQAGQPCSKCGCECGPDKTCRAVCETKKIDKVSYDCRCQDFCVAGKPERVPACEPCECENSCLGGLLSYYKKFDYLPRCGTVRTRNVLLKKIEKKEVPSYRFEVEDLCPRCQHELADK